MAYGGNGLVWENLNTLRNSFLYSILLESVLSWPEQGAGKATREKKNNMKYSMDILTSDVLVSWECAFLSYLLLTFTAVFNAACWDKAKWTGHEPYYLRNAYTRTYLRQREGLSPREPNENGERTKRADRRGWPPHTHTHTTCNAFQLNLSVRVFFYFIFCHLWLWTTTKNQVSNCTCPSNLKVHELLIIFRYK